MASSSCVISVGISSNAEELAEKHGWFLCRQFVNDANADIHSATTAQEILRDFSTDSLDYFVTGFGTGGTLKGIARVLREESPETRIIAVEPENSPVVSSGIEQQFLASGQPAGSHPAFRPHVVQGWAPDFMSKIIHDSVGAKLIDDLYTVSGSDSLQLARELASKEGIFCGISSGATLAAALQVAREAPSGSNILCMLPDTGERYLSTPLFEEIPTEMTQEELAISETTSGFRFDATKTDERKTVEVEPVVATAGALDFLDATISDRENPVVMFSLEWCEFCWSVRKLFKLMGVNCHTINLDSVEYQADDRGGEIRQALRMRTLKSTIPQTYVGGDYLGGCTETFTAFTEGRLQSMFDAHDIACKQELAIDPYSLLPAWLHPR